MSIVKIALTGGICSGKSYISALLQNNNYSVIDLDIIAKDITATDTVMDELSKQFGNNIIHNNKLNKPLLRDMIFNDAKKLKILEQITHSKIIESMLHEMDKATKNIIVVIPLLYEKKLSKYFDKTIIVECSIKTQLQRLVKRDKIDLALAKKMIAAQASNLQRRTLQKQLPTLIIDNNNYLNQSIINDIFDFCKKI